MSGLIVIYAGGRPDAPILWGRFDDSAAPIFGEATDLDALPSSLSAKGPALDGAQIALVLRGEDAFARRADLAMRDQNEARRAVAYVLEDEMAGDVEKLHFAISSVNGSKSRLAVAADREFLSLWLDALSAQGLSPQIVTADFLALMGEAGSPAAYEVGDRLVVSLGADGGFAHELELGTEILKGVLGELNPDRLALHARPAIENALRGAPFLLDPRPMADGATLLTRMAENITASNVLNLRQGRFEPRLDWRPHWVRWRIAAMIAGAAVLLSQGLNFIEANAYARLADETADRSIAVYQQTFPEDRRVVNARAQMQTRLREFRLSTSDGFLSLLALLTESVESAPNVTIESVRYERDRNELSVALLYSNYAEVESVREAVQERGGVFEAGGERRRGERIAGDAVVRFN